jgi:outer membrane protein TolC
MGLFFFCGAGLGEAIPAQQGDKTKSNIVKESSTPMLWAKRPLRLRLISPDLRWTYGRPTPPLAFWLAQASQPANQPNAELTQQAERLGIDPKGGLALREMLQRMLKDNPNLKREQLTIRLAMADLMRTQGAFSFELSLDLGVSHNNEPRGIQNFFFNGNTVNVDSFREGWGLNGTVGLVKRFETGTQLSVNFGNRWADTNTIFVPLDQGAGGDRSVFVTTVTANLTVQASQSFLRGAFLEPNLAPIWQAEEGLRRVKAQLAGVVTQFAAQAIRTYWDLVFARANAQIQEGALKLADEQLRTTMALIQAGKKSPLEQFEAEQAVARRRGDLLQAQTVIDEAETQLRILLAAEKQASLSPSEAPQASVKLPSLEEILKGVEQSSLELMVARHDIRITKLAEIAAKNATLPQLDANIGFTFLGLGNRAEGTPADIAPFPRAYQTVFDPRTHNFNVGIVFRMPLDNRQALAQYERTQIETRRAEMQLDLLRQQLRLDLRKLYAIALRNQQRIPIARTSLLFAQKKLEAEELRYKLGQSTLFTLLQYQQDLATAQLEEVRARVDLQKAFIAIYERSGLLLKQFDIAQRQ